jgi:hypothetical protein
MPGPHLVLIHNHTRVYPLNDLTIEAEQAGDVFPFRSVRFTIPATSVPPPPEPGYIIHDPDARRVIAEVVVTAVMRFAGAPDELIVEGWIPVRGLPISLENV